MNRLVLSSLSLFVFFNSLPCTSFAMDDEDANPQTTARRNGPFFRRGPHFMMRRNRVQFVPQGDDTQTQAQGTPVMQTPGHGAFLPGPHFLMSRYQVQFVPQGDDTQAQGTNVQSPAVQQDQVQQPANAQVQPQGIRVQLRRVNARRRFMGFPFGINPNIMGRIAQFQAQAQAQARQQRLMEAKKQAPERQSR